MPPEQSSEFQLAMTREVAALHESLKSAHKRIDENDRITEGIYNLASSVEALTVQVTNLAQKMENSVTELKTGQRAQGERIGALERVTINIERLEKSLEKFGDKVAAIEKKPAARWESLVGQVIGLVVAALVGFVLSRFL